MDPFEVPDFLDDGALEVPDIDLDVDFDCTDIMDLDCDPDFNSFLRELANEDILQEGCPCCDGAAACDAMSYEKTALNVVTGSGAEDSTSPPRSPAGSSGNESCQYDPTSAAQGGFSYQAGDSVGKYSVGRRATAESEDTKSLRVKERNRLYAARTRQRKNRLLHDLRYRCTYLEAENAQLQARVLHLQGELDCLQSLKGGVIAAPRVSRENETSPTPSTSTAMPMPISGGPAVLSVKPTPLRKAPNQKTKNKLRFTAAAAAAPCPPQDDASTKMQSSPPVSSSSHGSDSRGTQSSETVADKGTIQSYPGGTSQPVSFKPEPKHSTGLKRSMDSSQTSSGRRVRGKNIASVASSRSQGPLSGMATFGVLALAALSCIVLIALPALSILGSGGGTPNGIVTAPSHTHALMASSEDAHFSTRGLLQVGGNEDGLVPYQKLAPEVLHDDEYFLKDEYDDWVGIDDDAHHVLLSAAFICNHTTCVAVPKSGGSWTRVVPQVPVEVRQEDARARTSREATMFSALGGSGIAGHHHSAHFSAGDNLRGDVPSDDTECTDGGCHDTPPSANEALSMAGLFAPQSCELILRTPGAARRHAVGGDLAPTINSPAHANVVVNTGHRQDAGEVTLLKSVLQFTDLPSDQKKQLMVSQKMNKGVDQNVVSVLFPAWKSEVEEEGVLTPMRQMYVLVADGEDLLTYECSLSRALYI